MLGSESIIMEEELEEQYDGGASGNDLLTGVIEVEQVDEDTGATALSGIYSCAYTGLSPYPPLKPICFPLPDGVPPLHIEMMV